MTSANKLAFQSLLRTLQYHFTGRRTPLMGTYLVTNRCNLRCPHCAVPDRPDKEMDTASALELIRRLAGAGLLRLGLSGGEPLLREDIGAIITGASDQGIMVSMFTNGLLVRDRFDEIKGLDMFMTSFDGKPELHDSNRGKGSFDKTSDAVVFLKTKGKSVLGSMMLTEKNIDQTDFILDHARRLGIRMIFHPIHHYFASPNSFNDLSATPERYREVFRLLAQRKKEGFPVLNSDLHIQYLRDRYPRNDRMCYAGLLHFAVMPDGTVTACPHIQSGAVYQDGQKALPENLPRPSCDNCFCYPVIAQDFLFSLRLGEIVHAFSSAHSMR